MRRSQNNIDTPDQREKPKKVGALRGLLPYVYPYRVLVIWAAVALISTAALSLVLPIAVRRVVDGFSADQHIYLDAYFATTIAIAALLAVGTGLRYYFVTRLGERVVADIRTTVYDKMIGMSPGFYEKIMTGEVLSRITTDTTVILSVIGSSISIALRNALIFIGGLILMLFTSVKLTGLVLLIVPIVILPILVLGRLVRRLSRENQDRIAESSGNASETLLAVQTVQAFTHEDHSRRQFKDLTEQAYQVAHKRINARAFMTVIVIFLVFTGVLGVLWIGARDVRDDVMPAGLLVQFVIYSVMVAGAIGALSEIWGELQRAAGATERLVELLSAEDTLHDPLVAKSLPNPLRGEIRFDHLKFEYPSRPDIPVLNDLHVKIKPGETVALVGPSGAGKSTVFQMVLRFFDPVSGAVFLDGINTLDVKRSALREAIAYVPQEPVIFATTAMENIRFGRPDALDEDIIKAAQAADAHVFLEALPEGYHTHLGERGVMLSGGQKQRIAIARAILRDAPILLLDEATSALDSESEHAVQNAVEALSKDRTTLIVAHRLATVKQADRILVFEMGRLVARGTHDDLMRQDGLYARLAKLQFTD